MSSILELAKASTIVPGLSATAKPNIELFFRKRRRDLSSSGFICLLLASEFWGTSFDRITKSEDEVYGSVTLLRRFRVGREPIGGPSAER